MEGHFIDQNLNIGKKTENKNSKYKWTLFTNHISRVIHLIGFYYQKSFDFLLKQFSEIMAICRMAWMNH